jgi:hypothetical protein
MAERCSLRMTQGITTQNYRTEVYLVQPSCMGTAVRVRYIGTYVQLLYPLLDLHCWHWTGEKAQPSFNPVHPIPETLPGWLLCTAAAAGCACHLICRSDLSWY